LRVGAYTVRIRSLGFSPVDHDVTAERQSVTLSPDRNSYSTKNMTTAAGGTAVDVLRDVPSRSMRRTT